MTNIGRTLDYSAEPSGERIARYPGGKVCLSVDDAGTGPVLIYIRATPQAEWIEWHRINPPAVLNMEGPAWQVKVVADPAYNLSAAIISNDRLDR